MRHPRYAAAIWLVSSALVAGFVGGGTAFVASATASQGTLEASYLNDTNTIRVNGSHFPANTPVELAFTFGQKVQTKNAMANADGSFQFEQPVADGFSGLATIHASAKRSLSTTQASPSDATSVSASSKAASPKPGAAQTSSLAAASPKATAASERIYGLTLDDVTNTSAIVEALSGLPKKPTVRVVFDENIEPSQYTSALQAIHPHAYIMGEILDSLYLKTMTTAQYKQRVEKYVNAFSGVVDTWEIGNEINGEWLGTTSDVVEKVSAAYDIVKSRNLATELTLYYNYECWEKPDHEMFKWTKENIPDRMKSDLDQVMLSYYEQDCNNYRPSDWNPVFDQVHEMFPNSKIGFGETGLPKPATSATLAKAQALMTYYYGLNITTPNYVGGHFWWNAAEDVVPKTKPLYATLTQAMS